MPRDELLAEPLEFARHPDEATLVQTRLRARTAASGLVAAIARALVNGTVVVDSTVLLVVGGGQAIGAATVGARLGNLSAGNLGLAVVVGIPRLASRRRDRGALRDLEAKHEESRTRQRARFGGDVAMASGEADARWTAGR